MVRKGAGGSKPCVRPGLNQSGSRVTAVTVELRGDAVPSGAEGDRVALTSAARAWDCDGINHDQTNTPGSTGRTGLPQGQKREREIARTDPSPDGSWADAATLPITPVGHCWGVQQATAR
eukprot:2321319-Rhodomonas_salina.1